MSTEYKTRTSEYLSNNSDTTRRLRAYFGRVRAGFDQEIRTQWYHNTPLSNLVKEWLSTLETGLQQWPSLFAYEKDQSNKVGPMSYMAPLKDRMQDIDHYYTDINLPSEPISQSAISAVIKEWGAGGSLRIRGQSRTVENMKLSTNSGLPFFASKRRDVLEQTLPVEVVMNEPNVVQNLANKSYYAAAVLGWRGQEGGPELHDTKQRVVWMFPFGINVAELQLYQPIIEYGQRRGLVPAWVSNDKVDRHITNMFDTTPSNQLIVCTDFSKYDQHFNKDMQNGVEAIISALFKSDPLINEWLHDVYPVKYMIPLMYDNNKIRTGEHGLGSGAGGTNVDGTFGHRALQYEAAQRQGVKLNIYSQCLSDDGVLTYPGITVDNVLETYTRHGLEMNETKQYASTMDCIYLRRWHHREFRDSSNVCVGVYPTIRALGRLAERERYLKDWTQEMDILRSMSILENVKYHPMREEFLDFCIKGSPSRIGLDDPTFLISLKDKNIADLPSETIGYVQSEMSEAGGIKDWWVYQALLNRL